MYMISGCYYGYPTINKGDLYLMMKPYHWLVTPNTKNRNSIHNGSIVEISDIKGIKPVYVLNKCTLKQTNTIGKWLVDNGNLVKTVNNGKVNHNFYYNHFLTYNKNKFIKELENKLNTLSEYYNKRTNHNYNVLDRVILNNGRCKFLPCERKYAWWLNYIK